MSNLGWERLFAGSDERVPTVGVLHAHVDQPIQVSRVTPVLIQKLKEDDLRDTAGILRRGLTVTGESLDDLLTSNHPANSGPGGNNLGE